MASKRPKTSTRTVVALTVIQAAQLVALAVALVDDAQELDAEGELCCLGPGFSAMSHAACADSSLTIVARILSAFTIGSAFKTLQLSSDFLIVAWCMATLWMLLFVFLFLSTAWRFA